MKSESKYFVELATDIIYTADENGRFVHINEHAHTILGYSREELLGRHYLDLVHPDYRESLRRYYGRQYIRKIRNTYREFPSIAKDGSTVWLGQNVQILFEDGRAVGFQAVAREVTRRIKDEMLAQRMASILEMVAKGAPLALSLEKLCRTVEDLSDGMMCAVLVLEDNHLRHAAAPSLPPGYVQQLDEFRLPIGPMGGSCGSAAHLGRRVVVADMATDPEWAAMRDFVLGYGLRACWSTPIFSPDDSILGTFSSFYRVPRTPTAEEIDLVQRCTGLAGVAIERARSEMERQRLNTELEQRVQDRTRELEATNELLQTEIAERRRTQQQLLRAKSLDSVGRLAGGVAHEFNNWLTVILLYTEQLAEDLGASDVRQQSIDEIRRAAERASTLTRQLLAFGRKQVLQPKPLDLNTLLSSFSNVIRTIMRPQVRLQMDLTPFVGTVKADPSQIEQVLVNLALNARDAMQGDGTFTLSTSNVVVGTTGAAYESGVTPGEYVLLEASDTGIGMNAATREQIFEPFFTTKGVGQGSGLGLATVYGVIQQSGGQILVHSALGAGTTFQIFLPLHTEPLNAAPAAESVEVLSAVRGNRVIVIDDDPIIRHLVCQTVREMGCEVVEAQDSADALELCQDLSTAAALLLTDVVMPGMGGSELAKRALEAQPDLKILFISAYANDAPESSGSRYQDWDYLAKPFSKEDLCAKVAKLLSGRRPLERYARATGVQQRRLQELVRIDRTSVDPNFIVQVG